MIGKLIYLCPVCGDEDKINQNKEFLYCSTCQTRIPFQNNTLTFNAKHYTLSDFYDLIKQKISVRTINKGPVLRESGPAILRQGIKKMTFRGYDKNRIVIEKPLKVDQGILKFEEDRLIFEGKGANWIFPISHIMGFTTNSKYLEFKIKDKPFFQIYFREESPLKYEDLLIKWYKQYSPSGGFIEHQPKIISEIPSSPVVFLPHNTEVKGRFREKISAFEYMLHLFVALPIYSFLKWKSKLQLRNKELIPWQGPCILIANHESYLDPIIISILSTRRIGFFTKSTSLTNRVLQPIFRAYRSLPNRRYETDPMVIRQAIRRLRDGHCVGIFPEGERTWDGRLRSFKFNTVRFLLSVQVPLVIVRIYGGFNVLPRWSHRFAKGELKIVVQRCVSLLPGKWTVRDLKENLESYFHGENES